MKIYIYALRSTDKDSYIVPEEKRYLGQTKTLMQRFKDEVREALHSTNFCYCHRCNWIRKTIKDGFKIEQVLIEVCDKHTSDKAEIFWIAELRKQGHRLTNMTDGGEAFLGFKLSEKSNRKRSEFLKGRIITWGDKISESKTGMHYPKVSAALKGRRPSPQTIAASILAHKGVRQSEESNRKRSESLKGRKVSQETIEKIRAGNLGKEVSEETRKNMSNAQKGRKVSSEQTRKRLETRRKNLEDPVKYEKYKNKLCESLRNARETKFKKFEVTA